MRILVTGSSGFIGSHLLEELRKTDHTILALGRTPRNLLDNIDYELFDLRDREIAKKIVEKFKPEVVYHLASKTAESTAQKSPIDMTENNYNTFFNTIVPAINAGSLKKVIYTSSAAVYGDNDVPYTENMIPKPKDIYGVTKYANEMALQILAKTYNFSYVIVRPHNVAGERQVYTDKTRNVVMIFMQLLRLGKKPTIVGDGSNTRCYTYVKDVAMILAKCLTVENEIINTGADEKTSIQKLYDEIVKVSGISIKPEYLPERKQEVRVNTVSHKHAHELFNYRDTSFTEIIKNTWNWLKNEPLDDLEEEQPEICLNR